MFMFSVDCVKYLTSLTAYLIVVVICVSGVIAFGVLTFADQSPNYICRYSKKPKAIMNIVVFSGSVLQFVAPVLLGSSVFFTVDPILYKLEEIVIVCRIGVCLQSIGFTLMFGSMAVQCWQSGSTEQRENRPIRMCKKEHVTATFGVLLAAEVVVIVIWMLHDARLCVEHNASSKGLFRNSSLLSVGMTVGILVYKVLVLAVLSYQSWAIKREVGSSAVDSQIVYLASVVALSSLAIGLTSALFSEDNSTVQFVILSLTAIAPNFSMIICEVLRLCISASTKKSLKNMDLWPLQQTRRPALRSTDKVEDRNVIATLEAELARAKQLASFLWRSSTNKTDIHKMSSRKAEPKENVAFKIRKTVSDTILLAKHSPGRTFLYRETSQTMHRISLDRGKITRNTAHAFSSNEALPYAKAVDCGFGCYYFSGVETASSSSEYSCYTPRNHNQLGRHLDIIKSEYNDKGVSGLQPGTSFGGGRDVSGFRASRGMFVYYSSSDEESSDDDTYWPRTSNRQKLISLV